MTFRKCPAILRVLLVETILDKLRMIVRTRKHNGFAQFVAAFHFDTVFHEVADHLVDGVGVEQPFVQGRRVDLFRELPGYGIGKLLFVGCAFLRMQVGVANALPVKLDGHRNSGGRRQETVVYGLLQFVGIGRVVGFQTEQSVGIAVAFGFWRGGEAEPKSIEILENVLVLVVHASVDLIKDDQVEMPHAVTALVSLCLAIYHVDDGLVGGKNDAAAFVFLFFGQVHRRQVGQVVVQVDLGLVDERIAVGQEQHTFDPAGLAQQVDNSRRHPRFAGAGGHHQQGFAVVFFQRFADGPDGFLLVVAVGDRRIDRRLGQRLPGGAAMHQGLQFVFGIKAIDRAAPRSAYRPRSSCRNHWCRR